MSHAGSAYAEDLRTFPGRIRRLIGDRLPSGTASFVGATLGALMIASAVPDRPQHYRLVFALAIAANLILIAIRWPKAAALTTLLFLPFLALIRRLLIADTGWTSYDPLLLVGPAVALFLVYRRFVIERHRLYHDTLSKLVFALLVLTLLQVFNPTSGSFVAGLGGLLFLAVPLLWFFVGREFADERTILGLFYVMVVLAVGVGIYGLLQTEVGLPAWDQDWLQVGGFTALQVLGKTRAFGSFASSAEYAVFIAGALTICAAMLLHRRALFVLAMPFLAVPLFLSSGRGVLILSFFTALMLLGLKSRRVGLAVVIAVLGLGVGMLAAQRYVSPTAGTPGSPGNPLVGHQLGGLADPLNPERSTLTLHWAILVSGVREGFVHPFGHGTAVTNLAASRFGIGGTEKSSELDFGNAFISLGVPGGLLFIALVVVAFRSVLRAYLTKQNAALLAALGLMLVSLGQWLNGGYYALAPLIWFVIGWATKEREEAIPGS
jgi:hypothetical protein